MRNSDTFCKHDKPNKLGYSKIQTRKSENIHEVIKKYQREE
jgi:hypothetical protein